MNKVWNPEDMRPRRNVSIKIDTAKNETRKVIAKESTPKLIKVVPPTPLE